MCGAESCAAMEGAGKRAEQQRCEHHTLALLSKRSTAACVHPASVLDNERMSDNSLFNVKIIVSFTIVRDTL